MTDDMTIEDTMAAPVILPISARLDGGPKRGGRAALAIYDAPQALQLLIENRSDRRFTLAPGSARIDLMLRGDVLVTPETTVTLDEASALHWTLEIAQDRVQGHVSLVFNPKEALVLTPNAEFGIGLRGIVPDNLGGPRGTQVAIDYTGFVDEEGKSIADHLLRRLALVDEQPDAVRVDLLRSGSHASDGVLSLSFAGEDGAIIQPHSINGLIPLTLASVTGQALEIRAEGPRTPAFHIEPPSLEGGPDPIFDDSSIEGALLTDDNRSMTFTQAARITGAGAQVRLQTQTGTRPGLHPISIRYENLGPNSNMDGRLVLLVMSHPIRSDGTRAAANCGLVVRGEFEVSDDDRQSRLSINMSGDRAQIAAPLGGISFTGGKIGIGTDMVVQRGLAVKRNLRVGNATLTQLDGEQLEVAGQEGAGGKILITDGNGLNGRKLVIESPGAKSNYARLGTRDSGQDNAPPLVFQDRGGKVGIGLLDPSATLHINGDAQVGTDLSVGGKVGIGTTEPKEALEVAAASGGRFIVSDGGGDNRRVILMEAPREDRPYGRLLAFHYGRGEHIPLILQHGGGTNTTGYVGINTNTPEAMLDVNGTGRFARIELGHGWSIRADHDSGAGDRLIFSHRNGSGTDKAYFVLNESQKPQLMKHGAGLYYVGDGSNKTNLWLSWDSDQRLKTQIEPVASALDNIRALNGVSFRWNDVARKRHMQQFEAMVAVDPSDMSEADRAAHAAELAEFEEATAGVQYGLIAQEVEQVLPHSVRISKDGYRQVRYVDLIPVLTESVKALDSSVTAQADHIAKQQQEIEHLRRVQQKQHAEIAELRASTADLPATVQTLTAALTSPLARVESK